MLTIQALKIQVDIALRVAGRNRPNRVTKFIEVDGKKYVSGTVSHDGREHKDLKLDKFYLAVPNTSVTSWQISGDID